MQPDFSRRLFDEVAWTRRLAQPGTSWLTWGLRLNGVAAVALGVVILARIDGPASGYAAGALLSVVACGDWLAQCFGVELFDA
jgi:hypothetical protein